MSSRIDGKAFEQKCSFGIKMNYSDTRIESKDNVILSVSGQNETMPRTQSSTDDRERKVFRDSTTQSVAWMTLCLMGYFTAL